MDKNQLLAQADSIVYNARDTIFWWEKFATSYPDLVYPALSPKKVNTDLLIGNT